MAETVELNDKVLQKLIRAFKGNVPSAKVGVLGPKNARSQSDQTNAEIGIKHEFGDPSAKPPLPMRSFLRMPLTSFLRPYLEKSGIFDKASFKKIVNSASLQIWVEKIGIVGVRVVLDGFDSGGFGLWKRSNMKYKETKQTLVETEQLRDSIVSEVK